MATKKTFELSNEELVKLLKHYKSHPNQSDMKVEATLKILIEEYNKRKSMKKSHTNTIGKVTEKKDPFAKAIREKVIQQIKNKSLQLQSNDLTELFCEVKKDLEMKFDDIEHIWMKSGEVLIDHKKYENKSKVKFVIAVIVFVAMSLFLLTFLMGGRSTPEEDILQEKKEIALEDGNSAQEQKEKSSKSPPSPSTLAEKKTKDTDTKSTNGKSSTEEASLRISVSMNKEKSLLNSNKVDIGNDIFDYQSIIESGIGFSERVKKHKLVLEANSKTSKIAKKGEWWIHQLTTEAFQVVDLKNKKVNRLIIIPYHYEFWSASLSYIITYSNINCKFYLYDPISGKEVRSFDWPLPNKVINIVMGHENDDKVAVLYDEGGNISWGLLDTLKGEILLSGKTTESSRETIRIPFFASPRLDSVAFTKLNISPSGLFTINLSKNNRAFNRVHADASHIVPVSATNFSTSYGRYKQTQKNMEEVRQPSDFYWIASLDGLFSIQILKAGEVSLHLAGDKDPLAKLGELGFRPEGQYIYDPWLETSIDYFGRSFNRAVLNSELSVFAFTPKIQSYSVEVWEYNLKEIMKDHPNLLRVTLGDRYQLNPGKEVSMKIRAISTSKYKVKLLSSPKGSRLNNNTVNWNIPREVHWQGAHALEIEIENANGVKARKSIEIVVTPPLQEHFYNSEVFWDNKDMARVKYYIPSNYGGIIKSQDNSWIYYNSGFLYRASNDFSEISKIDKTFDFHPTDIETINEEKVAIFFRNSIEIFNTKKQKSESVVSTGTYVPYNGIHDKANRAFWTIGVDESVKNEQDRNRIARFCYADGEFSVYPDSYADDLAVHPSGKLLYGAVKRSHSMEVFNLNLKKIYRGNINVFSHGVVVYSISQKDGLTPIYYNPLESQATPRLKSDKLGHGLFCLPRITSNVSVGNELAVRAFSPNDALTVKAIYNCGEQASAIAEHPHKNYVAIFDNYTIHFFDKGTGTDLGIKTVVGRSFGTPFLFEFSADGEVLNLGIDTYKDPQYHGPGQIEDHYFLRVMVDDFGARVDKTKPLKEEVLKNIDGIVTGEASTKTVVAASKVARNSFDEKVIKGSIDALVKPSVELVSAAEVGRRYKDTIVVVSHPNGFGTGFFISKSGLILTNQHVLAKFTDINTKVQYSNPDNPNEILMQTAEIINVDHHNDLALIKIQGNNFPHVRFDLERTRQMGEDVIVIGNPGVGELVLGKTMTNGIISSPNRVVDKLDYVQTSAAINPGNSGGPIFDTYGNVFGVITLKATIEGAGFAISPKRVKEFIDKVVE